MDELEFSSNVVKLTTGVLTLLVFAIGIGKLVGKVLHTEKKLDDHIKYTRLQFEKDDLKYSECLKDVNQKINKLSVENATFSTKLDHLTKGMDEIKKDLKTFIKNHNHE